MCIYIYIERERDIPLPSGKGGGLRRAPRRLRGRGARMGAPGRAGGVKQFMKSLIHAVCST